MQARAARLYDGNPMRIALLLLVSLLFLMTAAFSATAAPKPQLWPHWTKHDAYSDLSIDHAPWTRFLQMYVRTDPRGINLIAYGDVSKTGRKMLDDYLVTLEMAPIATYTRAEQLAYWINLYNALTVRVVLAYYPVESIRDITISPGWFTPGPWGKKLIKVDRRPLSLDDVEHRILRPIWKDPRIHYALNCASVGCPNLQNTAFTAGEMEKMLDKAARDYVNHPRGVEVVEGEIHVSSIYRWFIEDFGNSESGILRHLARFARPGLKERLAKATEIAGDRYDWTLNVYRHPE